MVNVEVSRIEVIRDVDRTVLRGRIDADELRFVFPADLDIEPRAEPFLPLALLKAMLDGKDLSFDSSAPIDPELFSTLPQVQSIYQLWNRHLIKIKVNADRKTMVRPTGRIMSSFSGGVDSAATLADHLDKVDDLLTIDCYDSALLSEAEAYKRKMTSLASKMGKKSIFVSTNLRELSKSLRITWFYTHGPAPCVIAGALGAKMFYMPSSYTSIDLKPWGSHPVLDPLWNTTSTNVVHDGIWSKRTEKLIRIAAHPTLLDNLQVCYVSQLQNCGLCSKCVRTMLALAVLGLGPGPFPPATPRELVRLLSIDFDLNAANVRDLAELMHERGESELADRLDSMLRRFRRKQAFLRFRRNLLPPRWADRIRKLRPRATTWDRLGLEDPDDAIV